MKTKIFGRVPVTVAVLVSAGLLAGACGSDVEPTAEPSGATTASNPSTTAPSEVGRPAATTLRFTAGATQIDVTLTDNPTTRDLISKLPLTLRFEEFNGREKIAYLPESLDTRGSPGIEPENNDLICYAPWGNLGFYYNTDGIGFSDQVIRIGTYTATREQLERLENRDVRVELIG